MRREKEEKVRYRNKRRCGRLQVLALALLVTLAFILAPVVAYASDTTIRVESVGASPGDTVEVPVTVQNSPGILGATIEISYPEGLVLTDAKNGDALSELTMTKPGSFASPCRFTWDGVEISSDDIKDGQILVLTFAVPEDAKPGARYPVTVSGAAGAVLDGNLDALPVQYESGDISVVDFIPGDADGDKLVNSRDVIFARRHIVGGYSQSINVAAIDVNDDLTVNSKDVILMRRYIAGGYGVELKRSRIGGDSGGAGVNEHTHNLEAVAAHNATCTEDGNIAYWCCKECNACFSDAGGTAEISLALTVIPAVGHSPVTDPAVAPTRTSTGLTEGSHCEACGAVLKEQQVVPKLEADEHYITYDVANGESYLAGQDIANPNKTSYFEGDSFKLSNLSVPGYRFLGWYDGAGDDATKVTRISADTNEDLELYAHWQIVQYQVQFESDLFLDTDTATYTVDRGMVLPTPKLSNYIFVGWTDSEGTLYGKRIPAGTTGNITLKANWTSERNKTYTNPNPSDPIIYEDEENNTILFTYEVGRIENVPLYTIKDFGYISGDGVTRSATETYTATTSQSTAETISNVVANATTKSSNWTLSSGWNEVTSLNREWGTTHEVTEEQCKTVSESDTSNWNISNSSFKSSGHTTTSSDTNGWVNEDRTSHTESEGTTRFNKVAGELSAKVGASYAGIDASMEAKLAAEKSKTETNDKTSGFESSNSRNHVGVTGESNSNTSGWNTSSSRGGSHTTSQSSSVSKAISDSISEKMGYGKSYAYSGSESQGLAVSNNTSQSDSYSAATTYNTQASESVSSSWTTAATKAGYHRWVVAGTAHVFGVVGYDINSKSFFVYTYTVMDDETHEFEDYSYTTAAYNDNENGVISFEVPYEEVMSKVSDRVYTSDGLKVDLETGTVVGYTGSDTCVIIPEYYNAGNGDVVKITGVAASAFAGNTDVVTVVLSDYITDIPDGAFAGCTSLAFVEGAGVTSIGASAFARCPSMEECGVYSKVTHLGEHAFEGADRLYVNAANPQVALAAINSGAKNLQLNLHFLEDSEDVLRGTSFEVPETMERFELNGNERTFNGLKLSSNAGETVLNKIAVAGDAALPVKISSAKVTLNQSSITSPGIALALTNQSVQLGLRGTTTVSSGGSSAMLCRNVSLYETADNVVGKLVVPQKLLVCGAIDGMSYLQCSQVETIDEATFEALLHPCTITFDANGGSCDEINRAISNGLAVGELPVPTRDYYTFGGWYLENSGTAVTKDTVLPVSDKHTLEAHWTENAVTGWVKASDMPEDGQVVNTKWTYKQNFYRQEPESYTYYRWCSFYDNIWNQDSCWVNSSSVYHEGTVATPLPPQPNRFADMGGNSAGICGPGGSCEHKREGQSFWWLKQVNYRTVLDRTESAESASEPSGENIFEVVEWVQYRPRVIVEGAPLGVQSIELDPPVVEERTESFDTQEMSVVTTEPSVESGVVPEESSSVKMSDQSAGNGTEKASDDAEGLVQDPQIAEANHGATGGGDTHSSSPKPQTAKETAAIGAA